MKKLLLLVMIFPLFFACKHNTTSNTPQEPEQIPQCGDGMCNGEETCETCPFDCPPSPPACSTNYDCAGRSDGKTVCRGGECVEPTPECTKDDDCSGGKHCSDTGHCVSD